MVENLDFKRYNPGVLFEVPDFNPETLMVEIEKLLTEVEELAENLLIVCPNGDDCSVVIESLRETLKLVAQKEDFLDKIRLKFLSHPLNENSKLDYIRILPEGFDYDINFFLGRAMNNKGSSTFLDYGSSAVGQKLLEFNKLREFIFLKLNQRKIIFDEAKDKIAQFEEFLSSRVLPELGLFDLSKADPGDSEGRNYLEQSRDLSLINMANFLRNFLLYFISLGYSQEDLLSRLKDKTAEIKESSYVGYNEELREFLSILESGEIKSVFDFEFGNFVPSASRSHLDIRLRVERELGFIDISPISLSLGSKDDKFGPAPKYGPFCFVFPFDYFNNLASATIGDSLNVTGLPISLRDNYYAQKLAPEKDRFTHRQIALEHAFTAKAILELDQELNRDASKDHLNYIEIQYAGRLNLKDCQKIIINKEIAYANIFGGISEIVDKIRILYPHIDITLI